MGSYPPEASTFGPSFDRSMGFILVTTVGVVVVVTVLLVFFAIRYRRSRNPVPENIPGNVALEVAWILFPSFLALGIFFAGWSLYREMRTVPPGALPVQVTARQWSWSFLYPNGAHGEKLRVPVGRPVKLVLHSEDVIHSLYIPAFRVKEDAVPGMETYLWFQATEVGTYDLFCAEYCGMGHSHMITAVLAMEEADFQEWYRSGAGRAEARSAGEKLMEQHGCTGCHSLDGSKGVGPTFKGVFGRQVRVVTDGKVRTVTADREYLRRSILHPGADVVQGFPNAMPEDFGQKLSPDELDRILDALATLGQGGGTADGEGENSEASDQGEQPEGGRGAGSGTAGPDPRAVLEQHGCTGCHSLDGSKGVGPTFKGLYGREVTVTTDGKERRLRVDKDYLRRAILEPGADIAKGFPAVMPGNFREQLSQPELEAIVSFIQTLGQPGAGDAREAED